MNALSDTLAEAARALAGASHVSMACHIGPDGDALGSMLGLAIATRNQGKTVEASFGSPFKVPGNLQFLPDDLLVDPGAFPKDPELMVVLDAGSPDRLGELAASAEAAETLVVIDHHVTNDGFGDIAVIDPTAAATGELVMDLLELAGWDLTPEIAMCLHTALVTDTGRFQYANTKESTFARAARLLTAGARPDVISRHVYEEAPFGYLQAAGAALGRAQLDESLGMVYTTLTHEDLDKAGISWSDADNLIDTIRLAEEADVAVLAKAHEADRVKVSLRSRGATDVGAIAAELGGGGHRLASGFTFAGSADDAIDEVRQRIEANR